MIKEWIKIQLDRGTYGSPYDPLPLEGTYNSYYVKQGFRGTYGSPIIW
jgi:hypothetical protein